MVSKIQIESIDLKCFNKSYLINESDYILDCTVDRVDLKADSAIYSYVYLTVDRYIKGIRYSLTSLKSLKI